MKSFKEQLEKDFETTFFNTDEFAEIHELQGNEVPVVVDNDIIITLSLGKHADADGIFTDDKMIFVQKKYLEFEPVAGQHLSFDGEFYPIKTVNEDMGGYTIILSGNED